MKSVSLLLALAGAPLASADIPVHCLRHQIEGSWEFTLGPSSSTRSSCGHQRPDNQNMEPTINMLQNGPTTQLNVQLSMPDRASTSFDSAGTFTMIYDEGFEVAVENKLFFAFSKFDLLPSQDSYSDQKQNVTHCDQTLVGWYREKNRDEFGCYYGKKTDMAASAVDLSSPRAFSYNPAPSALAGSTDIEKEFASGDASLFAASNSVNSKSFSWDTPLSADWHQSVVDRINTKNTNSVSSWNSDQQFTGMLLQRNTWTAKVYDKFVNKTPRELNKMAGLNRSIKLEDAHRNQHRHRKSDKGKPASFLQQMQKRNRIKMRFPTELDWEERGVLDRVINQGDCGSCFTVSTVRMLSARNRIRKNDNSASPFSINFPLHCSEYNQGCDGGYAFLQSKWSEDVGLIPAACFPYETNGQCTDNVDKACLKEHGGVAKAKGHRYVGGYYGGADEEDMMEELVNRGPIVVSFEPADDFMYYHNGIYENQEGGNKIHQEWERVDHAVLLVGYGVDNQSGKKFWKVQNSWGDEWGENGFFRIRRGDNDSGVESIAVAADVEDGGENMVNQFLDNRSSGI